MQESGGTELFDRLAVIYKTKGFDIFLAKAVGVLNGSVPFLLSGCIAGEMAWSGEHCFAFVWQREDPGTYIIEEAYNCVTS